MAKSIHPMDIHVGKRLRLRRKMCDLSQEKVAEKLGITFQQIQKYERGANRISASRLYELAIIFECSIGWFFKEFDSEVRGLGSYLEDEQILRHIQQLQSLKYGLDDVVIEVVRLLAIKYPQVT